MKTTEKITSRLQLIENRFLAAFCWPRWYSVTSLYLRQGAGDRLKTKSPFNNRSAGRKTGYLSLCVFSQKWQFRIHLGINKHMHDRIFSFSVYDLFSLCWGYDQDCVELYAAFHPFYGLGNEVLPNTKW